MPNKGYKSAAIRGKKYVSDLLSANRRLKRYVPRTMVLTAANLSTMFASHRSLYIKPDVGSLGIGVCKATAAKGRYKLTAVKNRKQITRSFASVNELYRCVKRIGNGKMIVQKAISLATLAGQPYDMRMMIQRKPRGKWTFTGSFGRVAKKGRIVTNYSQGGRLWTLKKLHLAKGLTRSEFDRKNARMIAVAVRTARWLSSKKPGMHEVGIDFASDRLGKLWILEVNSNHPQFHPVKAIHRAHYDRMLAFARSYGRFSAK